jgi:hypothetical protein
VVRADLLSASGRLRGARLRSPACCTPGTDRTNPHVGPDVHFSLRYVTAPDSGRDADIVPAYPLASFLRDH